MRTLCALTATMALILATAGEAAAARPGGLIIGHWQGLMHKDVVKDVPHRTKKIGDQRFVHGVIRDAKTLAKLDATARPTPDHPAHDWKRWVGTTDFDKQVLAFVVHPVHSHRLQLARLHQDRRTGRFAHTLKFDLIEPDYKDHHSIVLLRVSKKNHDFVNIDVDTGGKNPVRFLQLPVQALTRKTAKR